MLSGSAASNDPGNKGQQYGLAAFNRPQRFVLSYAYDVAYKGEGVSQKLLGGWTVSGVTTIQNGLPFTVIDGSTTSLMYYGSDYSAGSSGRAELADTLWIAIPLAIADREFRSIRRVASRLVWVARSADRALSTRKHSYPHLSSVVFPTTTGPLRSFDRLQRYRRWRRRYAHCPIR